ncbi:unnamed protein product [Lactuca virosa]|uniref:Uncharacterized protein n=1 Tax=Lactuca virosa TaxID=75947 RepID=A0AAU9MK45_9ASTR|nr:unnamed protein product [Lactuca virosa]
MISLVGSVSGRMPITQNSYVVHLLFTPLRRKPCRGKNANEDSHHSIRMVQPGKEYLMDPLPIFSDPNYKPSNKLEGKVALVIGGDSGIGRAVCYSFAKEGATIAFTYVKGAEDIDAKYTLEIINDSKMSDAGDPIAIPTDVRYDKNCKDVVDKVVGTYGRIDVLVNNAAVQYETYTLDDITEERLERIFRTNIFSHFFMTRHAVKHMKPGSSIINTASVL